MRLFKINNSCYCVQVDESLTVAFGSPPEWIKRAAGCPFPRYLFLGGTLCSRGRNLCEVEFPIYKNFFFNRQRKTHIVAPAGMIEGLKTIVGDALFGPETYGDDPCSKKAEFYAGELAVRENFSPSGRKLLLPDFAGFESYDGDVYSLGLATVTRTGEDSFLIARGRDEIAVDLAPGTEGPRTPEEVPSRGEGSLVVHCFDSGDGFSPNKECSSFMLRCGDALLLFDPSAGSYDAFHGAGFSAEDIRGVFISHTHADHDQGLYRFLAEYPWLPVFAGGVVHDSLLKKIGILLGSATANVTRLSVGGTTGIDAAGIDVACEYGFHSIPSTMMKIRFRDAKLARHVVGYSGDTLYDPVRLRAESFDPGYRESLERFFDDAEVIIHEAGAGLIHTDPEDLIPFLGEGQRLFWLHTPRTNDAGFSRGFILEKGRSAVIA
ncbi:MAG: MBL fold metallo-hydrolase [Spirochaetes bacterium]|nr:MBL fold metallo-hydrolase [Spirochaetota bacterium]